MIVCPSCGHENSERAKFCEQCAAPLEAAAPAREQRKTVTVLFCDLTGSTALGESTDPEALRSLLARYFERMKAIVEAHGGTVEKFIGDAVMAVFGVPQVHEDDALRACRAAVGMRDALPGLGVEARIGLNTGEVVTGTAERLATGDAVNVAARLEQAAQAGEILLGEQTLLLVREAVEFETVAPLLLKGKAEPVPAFRLLSLSGELTRRHEAPLVGRKRERRLLADAWERAQSERSCHLFTILGAAGVGKSRLAAEFLAGVEARIVRGRCLSYGEGITYWPVVEILTQLGLRPEEESAAAAIRSVTGESEEPTTPDEIAWAVRKTLGQAAAAGPLVCVLDDLHWAEPVLLDLIEHVADFSREAPILLLCMARPELLDRRQGWAGGKLNAATVLLEPLSPEETDELIAALAPVDEELRARIREAAEGNPLFVEEMLAMVREAGNGEVTVPPSIQALLAARLDQLEASERALLERGAVEGKVFHRGAVQALAPEETQVPQRLLGLVRKELVRPDKPLLAGQDAFRFRHLLIRDAAYDALPKADRADLHERFAHWLREHGADLVELDEVLGYHLEQACGYRSELGLEADPRLAAEARRRLGAAGHKARDRGDERAAANLLERAVAQLPEGEVDLAVELELADALYLSGRGDDALVRAASLAKRAAVAGDRVAELAGRLKEGVGRTLLDPEGATEELDVLLEQAIPELEAAGDDFALTFAYQAAGQVANMRADADAALKAYERAAEHARRAGLPRDFPVARAMVALQGTMPVRELLAWLDELKPGERDVRRLARFRAHALAMLGRFDEARGIIAGTAAELADRGDLRSLAHLDGFQTLEVELLAGDAAAAVEAGERGAAVLDEFGDRSVLSGVAGLLARALYAAGRLDEAEAWAGRAAELGASDDALTQYLWRQARAKVLARRGEHVEAERLAREAVAIAGGTGFLTGQADAYADLAEVLALAGKPEEARVALEQALARYERKGNLVMAERTRERLAALRDEAPA